MPDIFDPRGDQHAAVKVPMLCAGTCTKGYAVSMDSSGDITNSATATLHLRCGVACESGVAGQTILVQTGGYCDFGVTDGNVASTDLVVYATDGGVLNGATEAEITSDPTIVYWVVGVNLAADSGTQGFINVKL